MKNPKLFGVVIIILLLIIFNGLSVLGYFLGQQGDEIYKEYCISNGNDAYLTIEYNKIACLKDNIKIYEENISNWKADVGLALSFCFFFNVLLFPLLFIILLIPTIYSNNEIKSYEELF